MRCVGIYFEGEKLKIAVVSKVKKNITVERLEELTQVPEALLKEKNLHIVTGFDGDEVVRRELNLKIKGESALFKALPFQLESTLPFSTEQAIVHPFFFPSSSGTDVVVFATLKQTLERHLSQLHEKGIDPDQISCVPVALARFAKYTLPQGEHLALIHHSTAIALEGEKIVFSQSFEDISRLEAYLKNKFGHYVTLGPETPHFPFAIPLGLALDGLETHPCQFRQKKYQSIKKVQQKQLFRKRFFAASMGMAFFAALIGGWTLHGKEKKLQNTVQMYFHSSGSIDDKLTAWQTQLIQDSKQFPLFPAIPSVRDVLAWLGGFQEPIEIVHFHYSLVEYPHTAKVDLEFKAASPAIAHRFHETLEKKPSLIDPQQKVVWTAQQDSYKLSFHLRKI